MRELAASGGLRGCASVAKSFAYNHVGMTCVTPPLPSGPRWRAGCHRAAGRPVKGLANGTTSSRAPLRRPTERQQGPGCRTPRWSRLSDPYWSTGLVRPTGPLHAATPEHRSGDRTGSHQRPSTHRLDPLNRARGVHGLPEPAPPVVVVPPRLIAPGQVAARRVAVIAVSVERRQREGQVHVDRRIPRDGVSALGGGRHGEANGREEPCWQSELHGVTSWLVGRPDGKCRTVLPFPTK
jgi:hypothetical protein